MSAIFKREVKNYLKRPLFWIGIVLVIYGVFDATSEYLDHTLSGAGRRNRQ